MPKRKRLATLVFALVVIGIAGLFVSFAQSLKPNARAYNDDQKIIEISNIKPGEVLITDWKGFTVFVVKRTNEQISNLRGLPIPRLQDLSYKDGEELVTDKVFRSKKPDLYVSYAWKWDNRIALLGYGNDHFYCENFHYFNTSRKLNDSFVLRGGFECSDSWAAYRGDETAFVYDIAGRSHHPYISHLSIPPHFFRGNKLILGHGNES